jgi:hypothetical protein
MIGNLQRYNRFMEQVSSTFLTWNKLLKVKSLNYGIYGPVLSGRVDLRLRVGTGNDL